MTLCGHPNCTCGEPVPPQPEPGRQSNEQLPHDEISALEEAVELMRDEYAYIDKALDAAGVTNLDEDSVGIACDLRVDALIAERDRYREALKGIATETGTPYGREAQEALDA